MRTRRGKRNRTTLHDQPVLYTTLQAGEQDTHNNTPPPGEHRQDNYNTGTQYDEVVIKQNSQPSIPSGYEVIDDYRENTMTVEDNKNDTKRKDTDNASSVDAYALPEHRQDNYNTGGQYDEVGIKLKPQPSIPSGYEVIYEYTEDTMTVEDNKNDSKRKNTDDASSVHVYAVPHKQKRKKTDDKGRKEQDSQDPELLYAKVNKQAKTKKVKTKPQEDNGEIIELQIISSYDLRLDYEPSADSDSTPQQQDGEGNTTQPTPSATVEGLYAEVDKTQKKNKKKDEE